MVDIVSFLDGLRLLNPHLGDYKRRWRTARRRAGVTSRLFLHLRRTSVRNVIRANIPETVAMKLTGHRTRHVFQRYAIVEESMLREATECASRQVARTGRDMATSPRGSAERTRA
jgi:hypothetical protein